MKARFTLSMGTVSAIPRPGFSTIYAFGLSLWHSKPVNLWRTKETRQDTFLKLSSPSDDVIGITSSREWRHIEWRFPGGTRESEKHPRAPRCDARARSTASWPVAQPERGHVMPGRLGPWPAGRRASAASGAPAVFQTIRSTVNFTSVWRNIIKVDEWLFINYVLVDIYWKKWSKITLCSHVGITIIDFSVENSKIMPSLLRNHRMVTGNGSETDVGSRA